MSQQPGRGSTTTEIVARRRLGHLSAFQLPSLLAGNQAMLRGAQGNHMG
jgi:hypothetical protein